MVLTFRYCVAEDYRVAQLSEFSAAAELLRPNERACQQRFSVTPGGIDRCGMNSVSLACPAWHAASMLPKRSGET